MPVKFPAEELKAILEQAKNIAQIALELTSVELYGNVKRETPVDEGRLQGSWEIKKVGTFLYQIYTNVKYALAVHEGSKPHWIYGSAGPSYMGKSIGKNGMLYWKGAKHPVWRVYHPGYKGNPFTEPAINTTAKRLDEFVQTALDRTGAVP